MKKREKKINKLKVVYRFAGSISPEEVERRLDRAFSVVFNEVLKRRNYTK